MATCCGSTLVRSRRQLPGAAPAAGGRGAPARVYNSRSKTFSIFDDLIFYTAPDNQVVGLDARTGELRWQSKVDIPRQLVRHHHGRRQSDLGRNLHRYVPAATSRRTMRDTGKELWKFYTTPAAGEPGGDSWADEPDEKRVASTWGSPGAYDPVRDIVYYGIANPTPNSRMARHNGNPFAIPTSSPSALYSNSTVALDGKTGKLLWYYQHLPGDDWDEDWTNERTLIHTKLNPNPKFVKWINPKIKPGEERDTIFAAGEVGRHLSAGPADGRVPVGQPVPL